MAIGLLYRPFLDVARAVGVDVEGILAAMGLTEGQLLDPSMRLSPDRGRELGRRLVAAVGDPEIGLRAAERVRLSDTHLLGYLMRHATHPLAALEELARYAQLIGDTAYAGVDRRKDHVVIAFGLSSGRQMLPEASDCAVGAIFRIIGELSSGCARPTAVRLARMRPPRPAAYRRFFGCPVAFEAERGELTYEQAPLLVPFSESDPRLLAILEARAETVMATLPRQGTLVERVRAYIVQRLEEGDRSLSAIAAEFSMSERTLRRRLRDDGNSYRSILDDVRRDRAIALVEQGDQTVTAIAIRTGFADTTAFARAYRRWTGAGPRSRRPR